jgi:hypothetical protein
MSDEYMKHTVCPHARDLPRCVLQIVQISIAGLRLRVLCCPTCAVDIAGEKSD